jgi:hypothetical protein
VTTFTFVNVAARGRSMTNEGGKMCTCPRCGASGRQILTKAKHTTKGVTYRACNQCGAVKDEKEFRRQARPSSPKAEADADH